MARPKGSLNRSTAAVRDAFQALVDGRSVQLGEWIDQVAKDDPYRAFMMVMDLARFCVPRAGIAPPDPEPFPDFTIRFVDAKDPVS